MRASPASARNCCMPACVSSAISAPTSPRRMRRSAARTVRRSSAIGRRSPSHGPRPSRPVIMPSVEVDGRFRRDADRVAGERDRPRCLARRAPSRRSALTLGELPAKGYASHGESWSFALGLKLAALRTLAARPGDRSGPGARRCLRGARLGAPRPAGRADCRLRAGADHRRGRGRYPCGPKRPDPGRDPRLHRAPGGDGPRRRRAARSGGSSRMRRSLLPRPSPAPARWPGPADFGRAPSQAHGGDGRRPGPTRRPRSGPARRGGRTPDHRPGLGHEVEVGGVIGRWEQIVGRELAAHAAR